MNYRSFSDLAYRLRVWAAELPVDIDLVVGVPRSGLLAASLLALHLNVPLTDVEGLVAGRIITSGMRCETDRKMLLSRLRVLVLDDSLLSGNQMAEVRRLIESADLSHDVLYAAVYITSEKRDAVDLFAEIVPPPRCFEWNLMHHNGILARTCVDIDGVLCRDPSKEENDDGPRYQEFIEGVPALVSPSEEIGWLVTCRLEKYRSSTEAWLQQKGVRYRNLIMYPASDIATRQRANDHGAWKAKVYSELDADLFVESDPMQAQQICHLSGKATLSWSEQRILHSHGIAHRLAAVVEPQLRGRDHLHAGTYDLSQMHIVYQQKDYASVRRYWWRAALLAPLSVLNLGFWSIGVEAFLGVRTAEHVRKGIRLVWRK